MRKNISTGVDNAAAVVNLDDDDEIVKKVTTETVVGRRKRKTPEPEAEIVKDLHVDPSEGDENAIDGHLFDDDDDEPEYSEDSLAALIYDDARANRLAGEFCTIAIRRNPDSMNDKFRRPCGALTNLPPLRNIEITASRMDIEDKVRAENESGGHYFFQIFQNGRLSKSWTATLSDPRHVAADSSAAAPMQPAAVSLPPPVPVDPFDTLINSLGKAATLKDLLVGDDIKRLTAENERLRDEVAAKPEPVAVQQSETLTILEKALASNSPTIQERLLDHAFPKDEAGHWIPETVKVIIENKETIMAAFGSLLGPLLMPPSGQAQQPPIQQSQPFTPPVNLPPPPTSGLFTRKPPPEAEAVKQTVEEQFPDGYPLEVVEAPLAPPVIDAEPVEEAETDAAAAV